MQVDQRVVGLAQADVGVFPCWVRLRFAAWVGWFFVQEVVVELLEIRADV